MPLRTKNSAPSQVSVGRHESEQQYQPNAGSLRREIYNFTFPGAPADLMNEFRYYHGETMEAFEAAEKNGRAEDMRKDLCALFERLNTRQREGVSSIPAAFLRVTVTVP